MPSIVAVARTAESLKTPPISVSPERCAYYRHKASSCRYCETVCPVGAIGFDEMNAPGIDQDACTGCGACASVCPTGCLECVKPRDSEIETDIERSVESGGKVIFSCRCTISTPGAIRLPCLARVDISLPLHALASGASAVRLVCGECETCPSRDTFSLWHGMADTAASFASALGLPGAVVISVSGAFEEEVAAGPPLSRRAFLLELLGKGAEMGEGVAKSLVPRKEDPGESHLLRTLFVKQVPSSRQRLVSALNSLTEKGGNAALVGFLFSVPVIDEEQCHGCGMCAKVCPTGALVFEREEDRFSLAFDAGICTSCRLCEDVCIRAAITRSEGIASMLLAESGPTLLFEKEHSENILEMSPEARMARFTNVPVSSA